MNTNLRELPHIPIVRPCPALPKLIVVRVYYTTRVEYGDSYRQLVFPIFPRFQSVLMLSDAVLAILAEDGQLGWTWLLLEKLNQSYQNQTQKEYWAEY